jgi:hypothetical protein
MDISQSGPEVKPPPAHRILNWRDHLKVHPAADLFPTMSADELKVLGEDIKKHGLRNRVAVIKGPDDEPILIDGRNRLDAMELVGLKIEFENVARLAYCRKHNPGNPYAYVISANIHRRHLTADQKRDLIAKLLKATPGKSNRQIAEQVKADDKTVGKVRRELEATAEFPQLETTTGKDGKARKQPIKKKRRDVDDYLADKRAKLTSDHDDLPPDDNDQTIWRRGLMHRATSAIGAAEFEDWSQFKADPELVHTVRQAAAAWEKLAVYLKEMQDAEAAA